MNLNDRYTWEAEKADGTKVTDGGDLSGCVKFTLIPKSPLLPEHAFVGVDMTRRFCRGFIKAMGGGMKDYVHCLVCRKFRVYVKSNGAVIVTPPDYELYL